MKVIALKFENYRNLNDDIITPHEGVNIIYGDNAQGKTNLSLKDVDGQLLIVSQFTLYADCRKGNRPSFVRAGSPQHAQQLYDQIIELCKKEIPVVNTGVFGADMKITLTNDGPFTVVLDSAELGV